MLAVALAASSALLYFSPLSSSRPDNTAERVEGLGYQDVDARLWQDGLRGSSP
jgi:hypothetical protein